MFAHHQAWLPEQHAANVQKLTLNCLSHVAVETRDGSLFHNGGTLYLKKSATLPISNTMLM